jgi:hypothetical protein
MSGWINKIATALDHPYARPLTDAVRVPASWIKTPLKMYTDFHQSAVKSNLYKQMSIDTFEDTLTHWGYRSDSSFREFVYFPMTLAFCALGTLALVIGHATQNPGPIFTSICAGAVTLPLTLPIACAAVMTALTPVSAALGFVKGCVNAASYKRNPSEYWREQGSHHKSWQPPSSGSAAANPALPPPATMTDIETILAELPTETRQHVLKSISAKFSSDFNAIAAQAARDAVQTAVENGFAPTQDITAAPVKVNNKKKVVL